MPPPRRDQVTGLPFRFNSRILGHCWASADKGRWGGCATWRGRFQLHRGIGKPAAPPVEEFAGAQGSGGSTLRRGGLCRQQAPPRAGFLRWPSPWRGRRWAACVWGRSTRREYSGEGRGEPWNWGWGGGGATERPPAQGRPPGGKPRQEQGVTPTAVRGHLEPSGDTYIRAARKIRSERRRPGMCCSPLLSTLGITSSEAALGPFPPK